MGFSQCNELNLKTLSSESFVFVYIQVLCGDGFSWVGSSNGHVPDGAVVAGTQSNGESLYVGRGRYLNSVTPGKIHKSHGCLYIAHSQREHALKQYEVLVGLPKCKF